MALEMLSGESRAAIAAEIVAALATERPWEGAGDDAELDIGESMRLVDQAIVRALETKTALVVRMGDEVVQIQDLPVGTIDDIARRNKVSWTIVATAPFAFDTLAIAEDLVKAAAVQLKLPAPKRLTTRTLVDMFSSVPDSWPDEKDPPDDGVEPGPLPERSGEES